MRTSSTHYILSRDHPYLELMGLCYYKTPFGHWRVKWRDFLAMKQDCDFATEDEARDFYNEIWLDAHRIERSLLEDGCFTFDEIEASWLEIV